MKLILRKAEVCWKGGIKGGTQAVTTESGVLRRSRCSLGIPLTSNGTDTDPAELIAAAYASSFSLALSEELGLKTVGAGEMVTVATVTLEHPTVGWAIMNIHLNVSARLSRVTQARFIEATVRAKTNCLVSRLLRANISINAKLER